MEVVREYYLFLVLNFKTRRIHIPVLKSLFNIFTFNHIIDNSLVDYINTGQKLITKGKLTAHKFIFQFR